MKNRAPTLLVERQLAAQGFQRTTGLDEVGRGTWAGPVTVGAVCLSPCDPNLSSALKGLRDSKEMTPLLRVQLAERIKATALAWGVGSASNSEIDEVGIVHATELAMKRALDDAAQRVPNFCPDCLLLDAIVWPEMIDRLPQVSIVDGDARVLTIAAASVIAKVWRDQHMSELHRQYPQYQFALHKGYGTAKHQEALELYGPSPVHRATFAPIRKLSQHNGRS